MGKKEIRIIRTGRYETLFAIPDGGYLRLTDERNPGFEKIVECTYNDETHFWENGYLWHIRQFAEKIEQMGYTVRAMGYDLDFRHYDKIRLSATEYYKIAAFRNTALGFQPEAEFPYFLVDLDIHGLPVFHADPLLGKELQDVLEYNAGTGSWETELDMAQIKNIITASVPEWGRKIRDYEMDRNIEYDDARAIDLMEIISDPFNSCEDRDRARSELEDMAEINEVWQTGVESRQAGSKAHKVFVYQDFRYCDFSGVDLSEAYFYKCNLEHANLRQSILGKCVFDECSISEKAIRELGGIVEQDDREKRKRPKGR
ncbi:pentapeptide repeat-containing protein [[Clostridium] symbiosum]|uniref:pentapeptide repeat-containing protein n=1 Tax=Clostridium symbiosum TaxID=1512 RepID=UPI001AA170F3|nr:pentapeptide repeat-containing protein [[Clostridium] symbiosum]MBO1695190.1 pentapeptide repeat-containing protein [[Clostridium] symbiosum]